MRGAVATTQGRLKACFFDPERQEFLVFFRSGHVYRLARRAIPDDDRTAVFSVQVERDGSAFLARLSSGKSFEVPWDFVLYEKEPAYPFFSGRVRESSEDTAVDIGRRVREVREAQGLTTYDLAQRSGIHRPNISRIENGRHTPNLDTLARLAGALGLSVAHLVAGSARAPAYVRERSPRLRRRPTKRSTRR